MPHSLDVLGFELVGKMISPSGQVSYIRAPKAQLVAETEEDSYYPGLSKTLYRIEFLPFNGAGHLYQIHNAPPPGYYPSHPFKQS